MPDHKMNKVYFAAPVQGSRLTNQIYQQLAFVIRSRGLDIVNPQVLEPAPDDVMDHYAAAEIYENSCQLLSTADMVIAEISSPSLGVGYEISLAEKEQIPVLCCYQAEYANRVSLMIRGIRYPKIYFLMYKNSSELNAGLEEFLGKIKSGNGFTDKNQAGYSDQVKHHFNQIAACYGTSADWRSNSSILNWYKQNVHQSANVLDLATGTGIIGNVIQPLVGSVVGIDRSAGMLQEAQKSLRNLVCTDALDLPFSPASFDIVTIRQFLHYVDDLRVLQESARVLKPGGILLCAQVTAPNDKLAVWWNTIKQIVQPLRLRFYSHQSLATAITSCGFDIFQVSTQTIRRKDPWERFLINTGANPAVIAKAIHLLCVTPQDIAEDIQLEQNEDGIVYNQHWSLFAARRSPGK
jgi:2'-deoxynucleoside 5'-phosphate N-hydrolase